MSLKSRRMIAGLVSGSCTSFHWATTSSPSLPSHWSLPSSQVLSFIVSLESDSLMLAPSRKTPSVAFSPAPPEDVGWMWMTPSSWVWMPTGLSNRGGLGWNSPQM